MTSVVLAEDHPLLQRSLHALLDAEPDIEVVADCDTIASTDRAVGERKPDVLVLDLSLADGWSLPSIAGYRPGTQVVVVTMHATPAFAQAAKDAGALGYVIKDWAVDELVDAVRAAARGEAFVSPELAVAA